MSSISSSTYYSVTSNAGSGSTQGIAGLMSGMDTESMVNKMLSGTQSKIDKQQALRQQAVWKQDIYRDIISNINGFYDKYFDTRYDSALPINLASSAFFNSMTSAVTQGGAVKVLSTGSGSPAGDTRIAVKNLATQARLTSSQLMSGDQTITGSKLDLGALTDALEKKVTLTVGGSRVTVSLDHVMTEDDMVQAFQSALSEARVPDTEVKIFDGRLRIITNSGTPATVNAADSSALGLKMTGLTAASSSSAGDRKTMLQGSQVHPSAGLSFDLTLDGVQKTITINELGEKDAEENPAEITKESILAAIQKQVKSAFGEYVAVDFSGDQLQFSLKFGENTGHELVITGADAAKFGITPGASSHINTSTKLQDLSVNGTAPSGSRFAFTINGKDFSFTGDTSVGSMMNTINNSGAGVRISYSSLSDTFNMEASSTGAKYGIEIQQTEGNLLSLMFGENVISYGGAVTSDYLTTGTIAGRKTETETETETGLPANYETKSASLKMEVNGKNYTFSLPAEKNVTYNKATIEDKFNEWLGNTFGSTGGSGAGTPNIEYKDGQLNIQKGYVVRFAASTIDQENPKETENALKTDLAFAMGLNLKETSNIATADTKISEVHQFQGVETGIESGNGTLDDMTTVDKKAVKFSGGRLVLSAPGTVNTGSSGALAAVFGADKTFTFGSGALSSNAVVQGQDARLIINGTETTRTSNNFTIDGLSVQLMQVSTQDSSGVYEETVISTGRDTDKIVEGFQSFVDDYNAMIAKLNGYISEEPNYRKYAPLTSEQKKDMSDKEVDLWEEKARQGLLRNDDTVSSFLAQMRTALYTKPTGCALALYNIGIETTAQYNDSGKLQLNEAALRAALSSDPESVRMLFTDAADGLSTKLMNAMKDAAERSSGSPGKLVQLAGIAGASSDKNNTLYRRITDLESRIKDLQAKYEKERTRYWNQFSTMETIMSRYNSQSGFLLQQFGGNG